MNVKMKVTERRIYTHATKATLNDAAISSQKHPAYPWSLKSPGKCLVWSENFYCIILYGSQVLP